LSNNFPDVFGSLLITAFKKGKIEFFESSDPNINFICPITKTRLSYNDRLKLYVNLEKSFGYRVLNGIPILLKEEAVKL
jgi:hypothetical protein